MAIFARLERDENISFPDGPETNQSIRKFAQNVTFGRINPGIILGHPGGCCTKRKGPLDQRFSLLVQLAAIKLHSFFC
jgi:hypothetical protein